MVHTASMGLCEDANNTRVSTVRHSLDASGVRLELAAVFDDDDRCVLIHLGRDAAV